MGRAPKPASRARRLEANLIDALVAVVPSAAWVGWRTTFQRRLTHPADPITGPSPLFMRAGLIASLALEALVVLGLSPGSRIAGVCPVLARDQTPIRLGRALVRVALARCPSVIVRVATRGSRARREEARRRSEPARRESMRRFHEELRLAEEAHAGDRAALNRAREAAHERLLSHPGTQLRPSLRPLLAEGIVTLLLTLLFRRIRDDVSGEIVVVESP